MKYIQLVMQVCLIYQQKIYMCNVLSKSDAQKKKGKKYYGCNCIDCNFVFILSRCDIIARTNVSNNSPTVHGFNN